MSFAPEGAIDKPETIVIRFDKQVVNEAQIGKPADPATVTVTPAFRWKGFWQDAQTLVVDPTERLAPSTRYTVALAGELAKRTDKFTFSFVHLPLAIEGVAGVNADMLATDGDIPLAFNQPVTAVEVAAHCRLDGGDKPIAFGAQLGAAATHVSIKPAQKLAPETSYTLACENIMAAGGNLPLEHPYLLPVKTRPLLQVGSVEPVSEDVPADEVSLSITFTTPVTLDAARKAITATPAIPGIDQGYLSGDGLEYHVTADLDTQTKYSVVVSGLTDTFGQKLVGDRSWSFTTGDARPRISMERGIFALEASRKGYPVWTRNIGKFDVECAAIPKTKLVQILTTDMNYDPWGGNNDDKPIDWKKLDVAAKKSSHKTAGRNKWLLDEIDLGSTCGGSAGQRGVFLAEVRSDEIIPDKDRGWLNPRRNRVLANVTDMGVLIKTGTSSGLIWVTSLASGAPVAGAQVSVFSPLGKLVASGTTNADGLVTIPGSSILKAQKPKDNDVGEYEDWDSYRSQRMIAVVEKGGDTAIVDGNWSNGIQTWNFGVNEDRRGGATKIRGFIQSDRGLYRPGETVHFKGIAREVAMGRVPRVPAGKSVDIEVQDSRGQSVLQTKSKLSAFGGFAFDLALGAEASLGDYYVRANVGDQVFREHFSVEEFRPASFELALKSASANPRPGDPLKFELDAHYLFGSPTDNAKVKWGLRKRPHLVQFPTFEEYTFSANPHMWWWYMPRDEYGEFISDGEGTTDKNGRLVIESPGSAGARSVAEGRRGVSIDARDTATEFTGPMDYILSTSVTDASDQTMGKSTIVTAHKTQMYLGMHANEFVQAVGMPFGVNLVAVKPDGTRVAAKAKLSFIRSVASCRWEEMRSRSYQKCESTEKPMFERDVDIAAAGSHTERIYPTEPGEFIVRAQTKDADGNDVIAASEIWVIGKGEAFWSGDEGDRMTVVASKPSYVVGETARLVAQANLTSPTALISVERDGVIQAKVVKMASPSEGVELPIVDAWAPNVYASIAMVSGRHGIGDRNRPQFKMGLVELKVATEHKQLAVTVALEQKVVKPGDKVSGKITVLHDGKPVKAEVALSAADEGVLQLISYETPNPMKTFYAPYGLGVDSGTNWNRIARIADPATGDPDIGGDSASRGGQRVRSKFVASAYWAPMLLTDQNGEIAFSFVAPDNLTAFRLMAVAADAADQFGAGETRLTVQKPLMATPALPRFLRQGDRASVGIVIHNNTDRAGTATVTAKADGAALDATTQTIAVPASGSARVRFGATASENAAASFEFAVAMGSDRDAVRATLPIDRPRIVDHRMLVETKLGDRGNWTGSLALPKDVLRKESQLDITVDRTGVGDLAPGLRSLVEYPYGCLEQTMSRFVPLVAARDLANTLDDPSLKGTKASEFIHAGVAKVMRHQQGDGLFSLWPQSETHPHLAAYALWGLTVAEKAGEQVPRDVFDRGTRALVEWSNGAGNLKPDGSGATMAMTAYVMALRGKPDASLVARLYAIRTGLPRWGQAFLLRAMKLGKSDGKQVAELQALVEKGVVIKDGKALVHESNADDQYHYMNSDIRASAMTLAALLEVAPTSALIDPLAAGLKAARQLDGSWRSTQENLWSLVALAEYGRRAKTGETTMAITVGGKAVAKRKLTGSEIGAVHVPLADITGDDIAIAVNSGAYITARVTEARIDAATPVANGFTLTRRYADAGDHDITSVKAGDLVTIKISLEVPDNKQWIALVDPIPAGFEVVNPKLSSGAADEPPPGSSAHDYWRGIHWSHHEIRDDRVLWFADQIWPGTYELSYQARATIDGSFTAMPATVEAMYQPDLRARTAKSTIVITK